MKKQGDVSRKRRLMGPEAKQRWYAHRRAERFARRYWNLSRDEATNCATTLAVAA